MAPIFHRYIPAQPRSVQTVVFNVRLCVCGWLYGAAAETVYVGMTCVFVERLYGTEADCYMMTCAVMTGQTFLHIYRRKLCSLLLPQFFFFLSTILNWSKLAELVARKYPQSKQWEGRNHADGAENNDTITPTRLTPHWQRLVKVHTGKLVFPPASLWSLWFINVQCSYCNSALWDAEQIAKLPSNTETAI